MKVEVVVPNWVNWIAVDKDGYVFGYSAKPHTEKDGSWNTDDSVLESLYIGKPPKNWKEELYEWK
jgi:hypothetical protein